MKFEFEEPAFSPDEPLGYLEGVPLMPDKIQVHHLNARLAVLKGKEEPSQLEVNEIALIESVFNQIEVSQLLGMGDESKKLNVVLMSQDTFIKRLQDEINESFPRYLVIDWASTAKSYAMQNSIGRVEIAGTSYYFD